MGFVSVDLDDTMGKTTYTGKAMNPFLTLILSNLIDYIAKNAESFILQLKDKFLKTEDPEIQAAINDVGFEPNENNLNKLHDVLLAKGHKPDELAKVLINNAQV